MAAPLLVVDTPSMLYRAFYGLPKTIKGAGGKPVNALLGTANLVLREVEAHEPRAVVLCFGAEAAHYRVELYSGYHADRPEMPELLVPQWAASRDLFARFGWQIAEHETLEADDLLGSLAAAETAAGGRTLIMTGDRDMYQCASADVTILYASTGVRGTEPVGPDEVRARYGIDPAQVPDFIALRGDPSDKLPGAKGVGPKTAASLLAQYGSLEAALAEGRFSAEAEDLRLYRRIAQMDASAPLPSLADQTPNWTEASALSQSWGLGNLAGRLEALAAGR
jgi:DNA polymerase-1